MRLFGRDRYRRRMEAAGAEAVCNAYVRGRSQGFDQGYNEGFTEGMKVATDQFLIVEAEQGTEALYTFLAQQQGRGA